MPTITELVKEMELESRTTRKMLSRVPDDKLDWQPHSRSMALGRLATHVAELPGWVTMTLHTNELDFAKSAYKPKVIRTNPELMGYFEETLADGMKNLADADQAELDKPWTLRNGEVILYTIPKTEVLRMAYCQIVHHRAQLGVFLRLLDIPIPGSYGPSADED
jgi:uncharacterized damage-inducible protein DinB